MEQQGAITHRFLILRIQRSGRKLLWLRLDRRANRSAFGLLGALGRVPSHDVVSVHNQNVV